MKAPPTTSNSPADHGNGSEEDGSYGLVPPQTVDDPNVFARPWVLPTRTLPFRPEAERVDEFVCETAKDYDKLFDKK